MGCRGAGGGRSLGTELSLVSCLLACSPRAGIEDKARTISEATQELELELELKVHAVLVIRGGTAKTAQGVFKAMRATYPQVERRKLLRAIDEAAKEMLS